MGIPPSYEDWQTYHTRYVTPEYQKQLAEGAAPMTGARIVESFWASSLLGCWPPLWS